MCRESSKPLAGLTVDPENRENEFADQIEWDLTLDTIEKADRGVSSMSVQQVELPEIVEWRERLERLYEKIRGWASEMKPPPTIEERSITLSEIRSGEYEVPQLLLKRDGNELWVRPVARWVIGAEGRVDLSNAEGSYILVYLKETPYHNTYKTNVEANDWFWVQDRPPWDNFQLDGDLFRGLAETCLQ
jgi:hypothetical protein